MIPAYPYLDAQGRLGIIAGDTWAQTLGIITDAGAAIPLTNCHARIQVRDEDDALVIAISDQGTSPAITINQALGLIVILADQATTTVTAKMYTWSLEITWSDGVVQEWISRRPFEAAPKGCQ